MPTPSGPRVLRRSAQGNRAATTHQHQAESLEIKSREHGHAKAKRHRPRTTGLFVLACLGTCPQPNWAVKRTPILASKYWYPACFALRCRLPWALGLLECTSISRPNGAPVLRQSSAPPGLAGLVSREFSSSAKVARMERFVSAWLAPYAKGGVMARMHELADNSAHRTHQAIASCAGSLSAPSPAYCHQPNWSFKGTPTHASASLPPSERPLI